MAMQDLDYRFGPRHPKADNVMSHPRTYPQDEQASSAKNAEPQVLAPHYKAT